MIASGSQLAEQLSTNPATSSFLRTWFGVDFDGNYTSDNIVLGKQSGEFWNLSASTIDQTSEWVYPVDGPDSLTPLWDSSDVLLTYGDGHPSVVGVKGKSIIMGFPFESVIEEEARHIIMKNALSYLFD